MTNDISNRELKEVLVGMKDSFREQNDSLKSFINQTNVNITQLNDNLTWHNSKSVENNTKMQTHLLLIAKLGKWFLIALFVFALISIGREAIAQQILGIVI